MTPFHQLTWENFNATVFLPGQQRVHRMTDSPRIEVFGDGLRNRIGVWLEVPSGTTIPSELSKLAFITTDVLDRDGRHVLEIATSSRALHKQFYHFVVAVAERVVVEHRQPRDAALLELRCFTDLLEEVSLLSIQRQLGVLGELLFLEHQIGRLGPSALDAWVGPMGEPHDFRIVTNEFEVKTTVSPRRIHTIHGSEQLIASQGCDLYLVSILLGPAGTSQGLSLASKVSQLSAVFASDAVRTKQFERLITSCGLRREDMNHYSRQFTLRRPLALAAVDNTFPAITRSTVQQALGALAVRVDSLQYDVDIEGLELEDGSAAFLSVLPR